MGWYSTYGTGATIHGIRASDEGDGRVEFTSWLSVLWIPVIPLRSWSAIYVGETDPDGITDEGHAFVDLKRKPHEPLLLLQTFARGIATLFVAILPSAYMIHRVEGRAGTNVELVFALASAVWPVAVVLYLEHRRKERLKGSNHALHDESLR